MQNSSVPLLIKKLCEKQVSKIETAFCCLTKHAAKVLFGATLKSCSDPSNFRFFKMNFWLFGIYTCVYSLPNVNLLWKVLSSSSKDGLKIFCLKSEHPLYPVKNWTIFIA